MDLDEVALQMRVNSEKDLHEAIVADLQNFDLGGRKVDVIYNSFVLEHVEDAALVLKNFNSLLKPGGLLILKLPDRNTVFGFITRLTPFWVHVFYKKYMQGFKDAGKTGCAPYPTYYHPAVSRMGIRAFCESSGFSITEEYGICGYLHQKNKRTTFVKIISMLVSFISFGKLPWKYNVLVYALTKKELPNKANSVEESSFLTR